MEQLVVWPGTVVGQEKIIEFEEFMSEEGFKVKYADEFETQPDETGPGGRNDLLFYVDKKDIGRFSLWRLQHGMRWWEDYLDNGGVWLAPESIQDKYPYTWTKGGPNG